jgi:hypothetical protein
MDCKSPLVVPRTPEENKEEALRMPCNVSCTYNLPWHFLLNIPCKTEKIILRNASTLLLKMAAPLNGEF